MRGNNRPWCQDYPCDDVAGRVRGVFTSLGFTERGQEKLKSLSLPLSLPPSSFGAGFVDEVYLLVEVRVYSCPDCKGNVTFPLHYIFSSFITLLFPPWNKAPRYSLHAGRVWSGHAGDGRLFICMCFVHTPYEITTEPSLQPCLQREKVTRLAVCMQWIEDTQSINRGYILLVLREKLTRAIHFAESISARIERFGFTHRWHPPWQTCM